MVDVDFRKIQMFVGNYDFWKQSSELGLRLRSNDNKKKEEKAKERGEEKKEDGLIAGLMDSQVSTKPLLQSEPEEEEPAPENEPREQDAQQ